jgi:hypothetical protein
MIKVLTPVWANATIEVEPLVAALQQVGNSVPAVLAGAAGKNDVLACAIGRGFDVYRCGSRAAKISGRPRSCGGVGLSRLFHRDIPTFPACSPR